MKNRIALSGNEAAAFAMKQIEPDVVAAYPITPQTDIVMNYSQYVADGVVDTEMIPVESEHSAMSACVGSSAAGARTMTATSANGLALMFEVVYIAASTRLPIVMSVVNRALSAPINIHCDHSDSMGLRESGWMQVYSENPQEVYHNLVMSMRMAEHPGIQLPIMVCQDGFITSHAMEPVEVFEDKQVKDFIGTFNPEMSLLDVRDPKTYGPLDLHDYYFEHKRQQSQAMIHAMEKLPEVFDAFKDTFGIEYDFIETYMMEDADVALVALGSSAGTIKHVIDQLREKGKKVGLIKPRFMRPFPADMICHALSDVKAAAILDRSETFSTRGGPLFGEIKAAMYNSQNRPVLMNHVYGLGGRELSPEMVQKVFGDLENGIRENRYSEVQYLGVR